MPTSFPLPLAAGTVQYGEVYYEPAVPLIGKKETEEDIQLFHVVVHF